MSKRVAAVLAVAILVSVPAATRAWQRLDHTSTTHSGFNRSGDCPPDKVAPAPPLVAVALSIPVADPAPRVERVATVDTLIPSPDIGPKPDSLRAPPVALVG